MVNTDHYAELEALFARLAPTVTLLMPASEVAFLEEYLDAGEYGLALETIVDDLILASVANPRESYQEIESLSCLMEGLVDDRLSNIRIA